MNRQEHQFGVGGLPEQEIRETLLAGGADDEIGVGYAGRLEPRREQMRVDRVRIELALGRLARQPRAASTISWRAP